MLFLTILLALKINILHRITHVAGKFSPRYNVYVFNFFSSRNQKQITVDLASQAEPAHVHDVYAYRLE